MPPRRRRDEPAHRLAAGLDDTGGHVLRRVASGHRRIIAFADGGKSAEPGGGELGHNAGRAPPGASAGPITWVMTGTPGRCGSPRGVCMLSTFRGHGQVYVGRVKIRSPSAAALWRVDGWAFLDVPGGSCSDGHGGCQAPG